MLKQMFKNQRYGGGYCFASIPMPETRWGKLLPLAFSLFFIFCLLNTNVLYAATATLSWEPPLTTSEVDYYKVYYGKASSTYGAPTPVGNTLSYTVTGLESGVTYYFTVTVVYKAGVESAYSNEGCYNSTGNCSGGGGDTQAPTVPAGLSAQAISSSQINLSWTASTDNVGVTGYRIYRCLGSNCTPTTQIATSATTSYSNTGLSASTAYTYRVSAYDAAGNVSSQSSSSSATTSSGGGGGDTQAPTVPTGLSAQVVSSSQINLSWTASTDNVGVTGYRIYLNGALIDTSATNSYSDIGLSASTAYTYTVSAYDAAGNASSQSGSASATTSSGGGGGSSDLSANSTGGDTQVTGGGCGFVKDDDNGNGPRAKGGGVSLMIMLIMTLAGIAAARRLSLLKNSIPYKTF